MRANQNNSTFALVYLFTLLFHGLPLPLFFISLLDHNDKRVESLVMLLL